LSIKPMVKRLCSPGKQPILTTSNPQLVSNQI